MFVVGSSYLSNASMSSNPRLDFRSCVDAVDGVRDSLVGIVFPYLGKMKRQTGKEDFDSLFDELDAIEEARGSGAEATKMV